MAQRTGWSYRIYEEQRDERMVFRKDGKPRVRVARCLRPCARSFTKAVGPPNTPLLCEVFAHNLQLWPSKVFFKGWKMPQKKWEEWIERLAGKYCAIWNQAGICDAILSSRYEIRSNRDIMLGLAEFWCSETNTFVFPWGEATVTLEDVMVLGGFSVLGRPVTRPVNGVMVQIVEEMEKKRMMMTRSKAKKAGHFNWIKHFMEKESKYEHVAFLSLWLSRFVFPSLSEESLGKHVFPIAAHLSQGTRVALAPAVLAGVYRDLSLLKEQALSCFEEISVAGPFQFLQLWALERFQALLQGIPCTLNPGEPRAARWHKVNSRNISLPLVRTVLKLQENFQWRPYAANLSNWRHSSYYNENKLSFFDSTKNIDENLQSYVKCLCNSEVVGVDFCKEKYLPHRVAMQFGMDQDLPGEFTCMDLTGNVRFFVPPRSFEPNVTERYMDWWKESKITRADAIKDVVMVAKINIMMKFRASTAERNVQKHKASSAQALTKSIPEKNSSYVKPGVPRNSNNGVEKHASATQAFTKSKPKQNSSFVKPGVPRKYSSTVQRHPSATSEFPKQVKIDSAPHGDDDYNDHIPLPQRKRRLANGPASKNENVKKPNLATRTEGFPDKKRNAGDFAKKLMKVGKEEWKSSDMENVQTDVPFKTEHEHKMGANVSENDAAKEGKDAVDDRKKPMPVGFLKNPKKVDDCMENGASKTRRVGLVSRVEFLEKLLGVNLE